MEIEVNKEQIEKLKSQIEISRLFYSSISHLRCPYFQGDIVLNSDGFNHLLNKPNRQPRNVSEQLLKLSLLKKAIEVIRKSGTVQEIREQIERVGKPARDGFSKTKQVTYWGFHAIVGNEKKIKIVVVLKKIGEGNIMFWSVLPHKKFNTQKLYTDGIGED